VSIAGLLDFPQLLLVLRNNIEDGSSPSPGLFAAP
jgi:hypothetical protein